LAVLLLFELRRLQPKVVCVGGLPGLYWIVPLIRWATRSKVIFYIHGEEIASTTPTGVICRWFYNRSIAALKQADAVVAVSQWTGRRVLESGIASEKLKIIYNGVDHNRFFPGDADGSIQARHSLAGKRVILTVARLDPRKGHETVLRAIPAICREIPNLVYLIVGDGPGRAALEELVRALRIDEHVIFTGEVGEREVPAYYRTCDLFVQPNRRTIDGDDEGFGLVFLEAAACQRAVVGGRSGGVPEAVIDGTTGILVDGHSVEETTAAIIQLLANPELANRMAIEGWLRSRRFNWGDTASRFAALCHQPNMEPKSSHRRAAV
jgi:phosphatidylinositol alpha-1,6-mannosyltransferase